jgi:hypothetical protein
MAFKNKDFSVIAYANGFTLWHYVSRDDVLKDIVENVKYFSAPRLLMNTGDIIMINAKDSTGIRYVELVGDDVWLRELK